MIFLFHQLQCYLRLMVVEFHSFLGSDVAVVGISQVELNQGYQAIVHNSDKLRIDILAHKILCTCFECTDAFCLNEYLIGERFGTHYSPRSTIVVKLLAENGYRFCTVSELATVSENEKVAVITVDDGYKSDYTKILPIIKKYNAKATFFVFGGALNTPEYMTNAELLALASNSCVEIGNHSYLLHENSIPRVRELYANYANADSIVRDFLKNKAVLESIIGKEVISLSYPNGIHNDIVDQKLKNNGVVTTLLTQERYESVSNINQPLGRFNRGRNTVLANLIR